MAPGRRPAAGSSTRPKANDASNEEDHSKINPDKDCTNVPVFDGTNFPIWQRKIKMHLRARKILSFIKDPLPKDASNKVVDCSN